VGCALGHIANSRRGNKSRGPWSSPQIRSQHQEQETRHEKTPYGLHAGHAHRTSLCSGCKRQHLAERPLHARELLYVPRLSLQRMAAGRPVLMRMRLLLKSARPLQQQRAGAPLSRGLELVLRCRNISNKRAVPAPGSIPIPALIFLLDRVLLSRKRFHASDQANLKSAWGARQTLQPEATGAAMEVTKWLKPSDSWIELHRPDGEVVHIREEQASSSPFSLRFRRLAMSLKLKGSVSA
jgi:hypothetical protein